MHLLMLMSLALLLMPLPAAAHYDHGLTAAAARLDASAWRFENRLADYSGHRRLKREARQFARLSHNLAHGLGTGRRQSEKRLGRSIDRLQHALVELGAAIDSTNPRFGRRTLKRNYRGLRLAFAEVRYRAAQRGYRYSARQPGDRWTAFHAPHHALAGRRARTR